MDWSSYLKHLQFVLKEFNVAATSLDDLLIWYIRNSLQLSIHIELDIRDRNLDNWQEISKQAIDAWARISCQALSLAQQIDIGYSHSYWLMQSKEYKDKGFEAKKFYSPSSAHTIMV